MIIKPTPRPSLDPARPWLTPRERVAFVLNCILCALLAAVVLWLTPGCYFEEEGEGIAGGVTYRPPHFAGAHVDPPASAGESSSADLSGDTGDADGSTGESSSGGESEGSTGDASEGSSEGESSSTGETPFESAHCDMTCPEGDALEPSEAQAVGSLRGCYCATPCEADDDCGAAEHCEPFFGRCTIACAVDLDCTLFDVPGSMACTLWWDDAEHFVRFCSYWNEDAP